MDQMIVDVTGINSIGQGDIAIIIGKSGKDEITACEIANQSGTISNELLGRLGSRLKKHIKHTVMASSK